MKTLLLTLGCFLGCFSIAHAQCPPNGLPLPGNTCIEAPLICQGIDGYCNTLGSNNVPQEWTTCPDNYVLNNDEWLAFVAGSTTITLQITPENCVGSGTNIGMQAGIYQNCNNMVVDQHCACSSDPFTLSANNFVIGRRYVLVLDGCSGDICDYRIDVIAGSTVAPTPDTPGAIVGDEQVCGGDVHTYFVPHVIGATNYHWSVTPNNAVFISQGFNNELTVTWSSDFQGEATLCLEVGNVCLSNLTPSCKTIQVTAKPRAFVNGGGVICEGLRDTADLNVTLTGVPPWSFTPTLNGVPQAPIVTSSTPYTLQVTEPGNWRITNLFQTTSMCPGDNSNQVVVTRDTVLKIDRPFCPGESVFIGGQAYTQPGIVRFTLPGPLTCNSVIDFNLIQLPQPERKDTIVFCPGDSVSINGQTYTQPGIVQFTITGPGCDTLITHLLQYPAPAPSHVTLQCPSNINIIPDPGTVPLVVHYDLPVAGSDCDCPGVDLQLTGGLPSGAAFFNGLTKVCYQAKDQCGQTATCCFDVTIREVQPCDVKVNGCIRYDLLSITADQEGNQTYRIRVVNNCSNPLIYTAIQLPDAVTALAPAHLSVFTSEEGLDYEVRNPNYSPFYSIRFKSLGDSISNGESTVLQYTLPAQSDPDYIHITSRLAPQLFLEAHLNTFDCPVTMARPRNAEKAPETSGLRLYPNPNDGLLWVDLSDWSDRPEHWRVFNSQGAMVLQSRALQADPLLLIEMPAGAPDGLYFLEVVGEKGRKEMLRWVLAR